MGIERKMTIELESGQRRKAAQLRGVSPFSLGQRCPKHCPSLPGSSTGQPGAFLKLSGPPPSTLHVELGPPLSIREVAALIGCSPWTVRQTLIPRGLPFFRSAASGRLIFYTHQIVRWIGSQQQGGNNTR